MLEFQTVEEMQAHYKAVRHRIANATPKFRPKPPESAGAAPETHQLPDYLMHGKRPPTASQRKTMAQWFAECDKFLETQVSQGWKMPSKGVDENLVSRPKIWLEELVALVCLEVDMDPNQIWSTRRHKHLVQARFLVWALAREFCWQHSLPSIGRFCERDHTTVMHGANAGKNLPAYPELARQVRAILAERGGEAILSPSE